MSISARVGVWAHKPIHYGDVIMGAIASQITSLTVVYSIVYSDADQGKHQSSASLAYVRGIHRCPHKWPVTREMFPFDDVIMCGRASSSWLHDTDVTRKTSRDIKLVEYKTFISEDGMEIPCRHLLLVVVIVTTINLWLLMCMYEPVFPSHYLSQCWPRFMTLYGVTRPQRYNRPLNVLMAYSSKWFMDIYSFIHPPPAHAIQRVLV